MKSLKVLPDPRYVGGHPYHQHRYVVTDDCVLEADTSEECVLDQTVHVSNDGSIIAELTDCDEQAKYAKLFAAAPELFEVAKSIEGNAPVGSINGTENKRLFTVTLTGAQINALRTAIAKAKGTP